MSDKLDLEDALRNSAKSAAPLPDRSFVDSLEQRLLAVDGRVVPFVRRARRVSVATAATITFAIAGVAAAAGVVVTRPFHDEPTPPGEVTVPTNFPATTATTTVTVATPVVTPAAPTTAPTTPIEVTTTLTPVAVPTPTAPAATEPPATLPSATLPITTVATTTTETREPTTLAIECSSNGATVRCSWSGAVPTGATTYAVLRGEVASSVPGRVFFVPLGTTSWEDPTPTLGASYSYLVHAFDGANHSLAHSDAVFITCC